MQVKVGSFVKATATGNQDITLPSGVPDMTDQAEGTWALIVWTTGSAQASGTWQSHIHEVLGFTTGPTNQYAISNISTDGQTITNADRRQAAKFITRGNSNGTGSTYEADFVGFTAADTMRINWSQNSADLHVFNYMLITGLERAKAVEWTTTTTGDKPISTVGFRPDLVLHMGVLLPTLPSSATYAIAGLGAMNRHGQQWAVGVTAADGVAGSDTSRWQQTDACMAFVQANGSTYAQGHYKSMDENGFTVHMSSAPGSAQEERYFSLCLKGVSSKLGAFAKPTAAAPAAQSIARTGFTPKGLFAASAASILNGGMSTPQAHGFLSVGAYDGTNQRAATKHDQDALATTEAESIFHNAAMLALSHRPAAAPTVHSLGAATSLDTEGFSLSWNPNDSNASEVVYMALGDEGSPSFPAHIATNQNTPTSTAFSNQRKLDRTQDGTLWMIANRATGTTNTQALMCFSTDGGETWNVHSDAVLVDMVNISMFIDVDDYCHLVWHQNGASGGRTNNYIYYMRGTPNASRTGWTWSAATVANSAMDVNYGFPDLVAHREGTGWRAHIVVSYYSSGSQEDYTFYFPITISATGTIAQGTRVEISSPSSANGHTYPSIDFNHTGDGKTVAGGTPHLYVAWTKGATGAGLGVRFRKATYSGGTWTWGTEREIDSTRYINSEPRWLNCLFDGTRVIIGGFLDETALNYDLVLYDRDAADTTTTSRVVAADVADGSRFFRGSMTYDSAGNVYFFGQKSDTGAGSSHCRKWVRQTNTLEASIFLDTAPDVATYQASAMRGHYNDRVRWVYTHGNQNPYSVKYDELAVGTLAKVAVSSPGTLHTDLLTGPQFSWTHAATQTHYAFRRRVGVQAWEWWDTGASVWRAYEVWNASATKSVTFGANKWSKGPKYEYGVALRQADNQFSPYNSAFVADTTSAGVLTKVGSFATATAVGSQQITGLGFKPVALLLWSAGSPAAAGTWSQSIQDMIGFSTGPRNSAAASGSADDAVSTANTGRRMASKAIAFIDGSGTMYREADVLSFDDDGFTLDWTTNTGAVGAREVMFLAISGSDVDAAKVVNWSAPTVAGRKSVSGVGFDPDLALHALTHSAGTLPYSSATKYFGFGAMNRHGQQWASGIASRDAVSPSNTSRWQQTDACIAITEESDQAKEQAHFVSMDADGFTTHFSTVVAFAADVISLCLKGVSSKLGAFAKTGSAAPATQSIARVGFTPKAVFTSHIYQTPIASPAATAAFDLGASDGTNQRNASQTDLDAVNPTQADSIWHNDAVIAQAAGNGGALLTKGSLTNLDTDGFSLSFNPNSSTSHEILYLAIGNKDQPSFPAHIRSGSSAFSPSATAYSNGRRIDRTSDGTLWALIDGDYATATTCYVYFSTDGGETWVFDRALPNVSGGTGATYAPALSFFIDQDDYAHLVFKDNSNGFLYYRRGTVTGAGMTWTAPTVVYSGDANGHFPDIVAHREGTGWRAHIVFSHSVATPHNSANYVMMTITDAGVISASGNTGIGGTYNINIPTYPSIDFNHTGDGKTIAGGTPHLYAAWSAGKTGAGFGIRFKKAAYSAGSWTWGAEQDVSTTTWIVNSYHWINCLFDGTRVVVVGHAYNGSSDVLVGWDIDKDTLTKSQIINLAGSGSMGGWTDGLYRGSMSYDSQGNLYMFGGNAAATNIAYKKWTRIGATLSARIPMHTLADTNPWFSCKRGHSGTKIEWVYTEGNNSPYSIKYDRLTLNQPPTAPDLLTPGDGSSVPRSGNINFTWGHNDPDGDAQTAFAIRRRRLV